VSWLALVAQLCVGSVATGQLVCVADDGHVAIELPHVGECVQEIERHHGSGVPAPGLRAACDEHGCADVTLAAALSRPSGGNDWTVVPPALLPSGVSLPDPRRLTPTLAVGPDVLRNASSLAARRSVVLLV
jgi:hypothetical protein